MRFLFAITLRRDDAGAAHETQHAAPGSLRVERGGAVYPSQPRDRALLVIVYACGLRLLEAVRLKATNIDRARMKLRARHGKGNKERLLPINAACLKELEACWRAQRKAKPQEQYPWFFLGTKEGEPMCKTTAQSIYYRAIKRGKVRSKGGIHTLPHSFAAHCLENEVPITLVQ